METGNTNATETNERAIITRRQPRSAKDDIAESLEGMTRDEAEYHAEVAAWPTISPDVSNNVTPLTHSIGDLLNSKGYIKTMETKEIPSTPATFTITPVADLAPSVVVTVPEAKKTEEPKEVTRKVYLRGKKNDKKVLVLHKGQLFEATFKVTDFSDLGGDECTVIAEDANSLCVQWGDSEVADLTPHPEAPSEEYAELDVSTLASGITDEDVSTELKSFVSKKGVAPELGKAWKHLSLTSRKFLETAFAQSDAELKADDTVQATG